LNNIKTSWFSPLWNVLWRIAVLMLFAWIGWRVRNLIVLTLFAGAFAYAMSFLVDGILAIWRRVIPALGLIHLPLIGKFRLSFYGRRIWSVLISYALLGFITYWAISEFIGPIGVELKSLNSNLPKYQHQFEHWKAVSWTDWYTKAFSPEWRKSIDNYMMNGQFANLTRSVASPMGGWIQNSYKLVGTIVEAILVPILAFYFLIDSRRLKHDLCAMVPRNKFRLVARIIYDTNHIMRQYVISQAFLCILAGVITWAILSVLGQLTTDAPGGGVGKYAVMLGIYAGLTRAIPILGPLIGGIPVVLLAALSAGSVQVGLVVAILFTAMHFAESKFLMPAIVGERIGLHAVWVIISLLIGAEFFGLIGMIFAAPVTAIARNVWRYYYLPRVPKPIERSHEIKPAVGGE
jgi:predicted PurR-regulated permease PerM